MTSTPDAPVAARIELKPCPFCQKPLRIGRAKINPHAKCVTEDCFGTKMPVVNLDVPYDVDAWNTRATPSLPDAETMPGEGLPYGIIDPEYAGFFTVARIVAWSYGYALAMHGSFTRDLDLVAVPWTDGAAEADHVLKNIESRTGWKRQKEESSQHPHGRLVWTLTSQNFECNRWIDFGFMPLSTPPSQAQDGWLPIESAPKNGMKVDLWITPPTSRLSAGPWRATECWFSDGRWWKYDDSKYATDADNCRTEVWNATNWRPLPAPPSPEAKL